MPVCSGSTHYIDTHKRNDKEIGTTTVSQMNSEEMSEKKSVIYFIVALLNESVIINICSAD